MRNLTTHQEAATTLWNLPTVVMAGAGSGKTTVLVERYVKLLKSGLKPSQILAVTFTNEAANQLKERISAKLLDATEIDSEAASDIEATRGIGTVHSFCYRTLNQFGSAIGCEPVKAISTPFEFTEGFGKAYLEWLEFLPDHTLMFLYEHFSPNELRSLVQICFSNRGDLRKNYLKIKEATSQKEYEVLLRVLSVAAPLIKRLESEPFSQGKYGFDDLEELTLQILRTSSEATEYFQRTFKAIMVDEFQDTSRKQWEILCRVMGDWNKLFVVGDPKQSIYRFRNADVSLFQQVTREISNQSGKIIEMPSNFRSQPKLLEHINALSALVFEGATVPYHPMEPGLSDDAQAAQLSIIKLDVLDRKASVEGEISALCEHLRSVANTESSIAILFRNGDRIADYDDAIRAMGLPTSSVKTKPLFSFYDVTDLISYLMAVENPLDPFRMMALLRSRYIGLETSRLVAYFENTKSDWLGKLRDEVTELKWFFELLDSGDYLVDSVLEILMEHSSYFPADREAVHYFLSGISGQGWSVSQALTAIDYWKEEKLNFVCKSEVASKQVIRLMTVHAAKGLEFDHVYLADTMRVAPHHTPPIRIDAEGLPGLRFKVAGTVQDSMQYQQLKEKDQAGDKEEARRVLYVAITRAKKGLYAFLPNDVTMIPNHSWAHWISAYDQLGNDPGGL